MGIKWTFYLLGVSFSCSSVLSSPSKMCQQLSALSLCLGTGNIPSYLNWTWRFWKLWSSTTNWWMRAPCTQPTPNSSTLHNSQAIPTPLESLCRSVSLESGNSVESGNSLLLNPRPQKTHNQNRREPTSNMTLPLQEIGIYALEQKVLLGHRWKFPKIPSIIHFLQLELGVAAAWWRFLLWVMSISK